MTKEAYVNKNLNNCILEESDWECMFNKGQHRIHFITWFCGTAKECHEIGNEKAFLQAKDNVERWYTAVGKRKS